MEKTFTIRIPKNLKKEIQKHKEINWSEVIRKSIQRKIRKIQLANELVKDSELTEKEAEEISKQIKHKIAQRHKEEEK